MPPHCDSLDGPVVKAAMPVPEAREYVEAMLGLQVWSHGLGLAIHAGPYGEAEAHEH